MKTILLYQRWFVIVTVFSSIQVSAQCPANIGFEQGDFTNWICSIGKVDGTGTVSVSGTAPVPGRHTMLKNTFPQAKDPFGHFSVNCPNGSNYSIQLGNSSTGAQAERVSYEFTIPAGQNIFSIIYNYAVVLQNPNHNPYEQPRFTAYVFDVNANQYIDCPSFSFVADGNLPGFKQSDVDKTVLYKEWSPVTIKLIGYAGKTIRLEFTTNDCTKGGHFGYAYVDVNENCTSPISGNVFCNGQSKISLTSPFGFKQYDWYDSSFSNQLGSSNVLTLSPPPPVGTKIALILTPYPGYGCLDTVYTTIQQSPDAFNFILKDSVSSCINLGADITKPIVSAGSTPNLNFYYYTDPDGLIYLGTPKNVTSAGTYYIKAQNTAGCTDIKPITVFINPSPDVKLASAINNSTVAICKPAVLDLTSSSVVNVNGNYNISYWKDIDAIISLPSPNNIQSSGTYYIKATDNYGCYTTLPLTALVDNPPVFSVTPLITDCGFASININKSVTGIAGNYTYSYWTDAATSNPLNNTDSIVQSGTYYIKANTALGCSTTLPVTVKVNPNPTLTVSNPSPVTFPVTVDVYSTFSKLNGINYSFWKNAALTNPVTNPASLDSSGTYYIKATDSLGCTAVKAISVVIKEPTIVPPNAFSPNGDGINDTWQIQYLHARNPQCVVQVFNRAGQMVFQSNGYAKPWDGRYQGNLLPFGTYYYIIKQNSFSQPISGSITILP